MKSSTNRPRKPRKPVAKIIQDPRRIYVRRIEAGLKQHELAGLAGISPQHMSRIESGKQGASPDTLGRLAVALRCEVVDLMPAEYQEVKSA